MFDTRRFGGYISRQRKKADMTQSELADKLGLTRQAVSKYEVGDSFPDVSILVLIAEVFQVTLDELINAGNPTHNESLILGSLALGKNDVAAESVADIENLAPFLKPSILKKMAEGLSKQGIDISNIVRLAEYLDNDAVLTLMEKASFETVSDELIGKLIPFLDDTSKGLIFQKIIEGRMNWRLLKELVPYAESMCSLVEAAVVEGALPLEALEVLQEGLRVLWEKRNRL